MNTKDVLRPKVYGLGDLNSTCYSDGGKTSIQ